MSKSAAAGANRFNSRIIEHVPVDSLKPYPGSARTHPKKQIQKLAGSLKRFGFALPILVDEACVVLAGHALIEAAKMIGMREVPILRMENLSENDKRALRLALNRLAEDGAWDREKLAIELKFLSDAQFAIETTAFEIAEVDLILDELPVPVGDGPGPEDELPLAADGLPAVSMAGDLWELGRHRVLCADARNTDAYELLLDSERAAMAFSDPPYNVKISDVSGRGRTKHDEFAMASGEMTRLQYARFLTHCFNPMASSSADGAVHFLCTDGKHLVEMTSAVEDAYDEHLTLVVWNKLSGGMGGLYRNQHELIFVEKVGRAPSLNNVQLGKYGRNRTTVWTYRGLSAFGKDRLDQLAMHPTVKPVAMVADAILDVSRRNDIVLDPFGGSGTTLIAAEKTGRRARLMEIDPGYCDLIVRRWQAYAGKAARLVSNGAPFEEVEAQRAGTTDAVSH